MTTLRLRSRGGGPRRSARAACLGLAAAVAFGPTAALAVPRCPNDTEQAVFEVEALKSELMVVATTCKGNNEDRYNAFVERYRPALIQSNRMLGQYFTKAYGRSAQRANDAFITELANARSNAARQLGGDFCMRNAGLFEEVMALPGATDLPAYAATKDLLSAGVTACPGARAATPAAAASSSSSRRSARR
jgi:hypothetical protein